MDSVASALLAAWSFEPGLVLALSLVALLYARGFRQLHAQLPSHFPSWRRTAFLGGMAAIALALVSPVDAFADLLLQIHMAQHWLLMMVAPPLLWLGAPAIPLLRGLPRSWLRRGVGPVLAWPPLRRGLLLATDPRIAFSVWAVTTLAWHLPVAYQAALRSRDLHDLEHAMFLSAALLFWYPVISPWPSKERIARPWLVLYLAAAALFNTLFGAVFAFSDRVFYSAYRDAPSPWRIDALADQNAAGAFVWIAVSLPMLIAVVSVLLPMLDLPRERALRRGRTQRPASSRTLASPRRFELGALIRSRRARRTAQWTLFGLAGLIVLDGLLGEQPVSALNLAGVLPWTYWRGFAVLALLVLGNVFCAVCPFTLSRSLAGRWRGRSFRWPSWLDNKWPALAFFVLYLWAYEVFSLWDSPLWTAWIVVGYFVAFFLVEALFGRGRFCRHVCPIGQLHFVASGMSPTEVRRIDPAVCGTCRTHDCLRGNDRDPGCPTGLFLPTKQGSLDCTYCLDCVRACPHENAAVVGIDPGSLLGRERTPRVDVAALMLVFCFGAFANAAAMLAPVVRWEQAFGSWLGVDSRGIPLSLGLAVALIVAPLAAALGCGFGSRVLGRSAHSTLTVTELAARFAPALIPIGFAMWLAHFGFHLATGIGTLGPAAARAMHDLGLFGARGGAWVASGTTSSMGPLVVRLEGFEIALLGVGLVISVAVAWRIAHGLVSERGRASALAAPWFVLAGLLYLAGVWIVLQPMEMRGMVM